MKKEKKILWIWGTTLCVFSLGAIGAMLTPIIYTELQPKPLTILTISIKPNPTGITQDDINNISSWNEIEKINSLSKLFEGINEGNINKLKPILNENGNQVILYAEVGYCFNEQTSIKINSNVFTI